MSELALSNVINVTISGMPQGLSERNVNNIALFSTESPTNTDIYRDYYSAREVALDYGTGSVAEDMATAIFSQTPNIMTGKGVLRIIPMLGAVSATAGYWTSADITTKVAAIILVTNGYIKVTVDAVEYNITGLDFTSVTTLEGIAAVLQARLVNALVTASATQLIFTSKSVGADADVVVSVGTGSGTDLAGANYFSTATGTPSTGVNSSGETLEAAIARTESLIPYVGVITDLEMEDSVIFSLAAFIQARDMLFVHQFCSTVDIATSGIIDDITAASDTHTRCLLYTASRAEANLMKSAYVGRAFSTNFSGSATSTTMNLKSLATILPDDGINQTTYNLAKVNGADLYVSYSGVPSAVSNGADLYFDQIYSRLALKFALEAGGFNYLRQTNTKVPQTESGMIGLKNAYIVQLNRFVINGYIGVGLQWNSSETFGDPEDFRRNITENGYYCYSQPISQQIQSERETRIAPLVQIAVKEAGAIQKSDVIVIVEA